MSLSLDGPSSCFRAESSCQCALSIPREVDDEEIFIEVFAGMSAPPPDDSEPSDDFDEGQNRSGWYVACNGRIVLAADKTTTTGWGTEGWPQWHPQYSGFIGIILFSSPRADLLPLTTTKRSVDETSAIYRRYRPKMREASKKWTSYTNIRKQAREEAARKEQAAKAVPIFEIAFKDDVEVAEEIHGSQGCRTQMCSTTVPRSAPQEARVSLRKHQHAIQGSWHSVIRLCFR